MSTATDAKRARLQVALSANGLSTDGDFQECLDRLLSAGTNKRGRPSNAVKPPAATSALQIALKANVAANVEGLSAPLKKQLSMALVGVNDSDADAIATALMAPSQT